MEGAHLYEQAVKGLVEQQSSTYASNAAMERHTTTVPFTRYARIHFPALPSQIVGWDLAVDVLRQAVTDIQEAHAQDFLERNLAQIVSILLDQRCLPALIHEIDPSRLRGIACIA